MLLLELNFQARIFVVFPLLPLTWEY